MATKRRAHPAHHFSDQGEANLILLDVPFANPVNITPFMNDIGGAFGLDFFNSDGSRSMLGCRNFALFDFAGDLTTLGNLRRTVTPIPSPGAAPLLLSSLAFLARMGRRVMTRQTAGCWLRSRSAGATLTIRLCASV